MAINPSNTSWGSDTKNINYIGKDFATFKQNLIDFTKTYFPNTYSDFNEASPGMVFIEQAAAIGDVLSFYQDTQLKESMLSHATERKNVVSLAQSMGYKPKVTSPAITTLTVYQLIPSVYNAASNSGVNYEVDSRFYFKIKAGFEVQSSTNSNVSFITTDAIDFENPTDRTIEVYERDSTTGTPTQYLISKKIKAISARENTTGITLGSDTDYPSIQLSETNIIQIVSIADSNNNKYYEVPYLAQESIFVEQPNVNELSYYSGSVPYILEVQKVPRRFSVKINSDNTTEIQFGSGDVNLRDEQILPNTKNIGLGLANSINRLNQGIDPSNFLKTNTFGIAPAGQVLQIKYLTGGGISSNVNVGDLTKIQKVEFDDDLLAITTGLVGMYNSFKS
jgi:hypothetical protein